jgi:hypothetical protein
MRALAFLTIGALALLTRPALAQSEAETALARYCEPLVSGSAPAAAISDLAREHGFTEQDLAGTPVLLRGETLVSVSDEPLACFVQAPSSMAFDEGVSLVDGWAALDPAAVRSPATTGPDGARVRAWSSPARQRSLILAEQTNALQRKVLAFILMPLPQAQR